MQPHEKSPSSLGVGGASQRAGQTSGTSVPRLPDAWHQQTEWEVAASYADGFRDGYAAAEKAIAEEIRRAVGVKAYDRRDVIRWLIRVIDQPREPYSSSANGTTLTVAERQSFGELGRVA